MYTFILYMKNVMYILNMLINFIKRAGYVLNMHACQVYIKCIMVRPTY